MFENVKLRNRILGGYGIPVALSLLTAIVVYSQGVKQVQLQAQKVKTAHYHIENVKDLAFSIAQMEQSARGYLIGRKASELNAYEEWDTVFFEQSEKLRQLVTEEVQQEQLNEIIQVGDRMNEFYRRLISYVELSKPEKFQQVWNQGEINTLTDNLSTLVQKFEAREQEILDTEETAQTQALQRLTFTVFGLTGLSASLALTAGLWIASAISAKMNQETSAIASSSSEIATTMANQEQHSTEQAAAVHETTTTIHELSVTLKKGQQQAEHSALSARQALGFAEKGQEAVQQTVQAMETLNHKVIAIAQRSNQLRDKSSQIENITRLVGEIAVQTNMLALNASIEAVRAGSEGTGFGVVASQIRQLADQSQQAAQKINALIAEIRQDIQATANVTQEGEKTVQQAVNIAEEMAQVFNAVAESINTVVLNNQQMSLNANQESIGIEQILRAMNDINEVAQANAQGAVQVKEGTQQLNESVLNLKGML